MGNTEEERLARAFGEQVRELRTAHGWTQVELAKRLTEAGYTMRQTTIAKIEAGSRPTSVPEVVAMAKTLDVTVGALFSKAMDEPAILGDIIVATNELVTLGEQVENHFTVIADLDRRIGHQVRRIRELQELARESILEPENTDFERVMRAADMAILSFALVYARLTNNVSDAAQGFLNAAQGAVPQ